ncbi:MAG: hypothetical protein Q9O62_00715 [Ardenticatenia bacterium]|nr:hypothetical protein [Ardenticatenia bacterium]
MRNEWFYEQEPSSRFVIQEHLRQALWRMGLGMAWVEVERETPPYRAVVYWYDRRWTLEWEPAKYVRLSMPEDLPDVLRVMELMLGFRPLARYRQAGQMIWEWWRRRTEREARWQELSQQEGLEELERLYPTLAAAG